MIPNNTDILVTHGSPYGILDKIKVDKKFRHTGCHILADKIKQIKPQLHIFGHVHEEYGIMTIDNTTYINTSLLNDKYELVNKCHVINFIKKDYI